METLIIQQIQHAVHVSKAIFLLGHRSGLKTVIIKSKALFSLGHRTCSDLSIDGRNIRKNGLL